MGEWRHRPTVAEGIVTRIEAPRQRMGTVSGQALRKVSNLPILVPTFDWPKIVTGQKQMFRTWSGMKGNHKRRVVPEDTECPRPCLLYSIRFDGPGRSRRWEAVPGVLLSHRQEPLGSISPEDLAAEGFEFLPAFKYYWKQRYQRLGWRPWDPVNVLEARPLGDDQDAQDWAARWAFNKLYREWLQ